MFRFCKTNVPWACVIVVGQCLSLWWGFGYFGPLVFGFDGFGGSGVACGVSCCFWVVLGYFVGWLRFVNFCFVEF